MTDNYNSRLADDLERLCCAETEGKFFDCVTDNIQTIIAALRATQEPARFDGEVALEEFEAKPGKCARCGFSREDHSYNGACYGLCGKFVEVKK